MTQARAETASQRHYRPELDGVRALAITGVVAQHLGLRHAPAGALGVDVFFVLSGYLITGLLIGEREKYGHVDLPAFYVRRAARLLPALVSFLLVGSALALFDFGTPTRVVLVAGAVAITYTTDLWSYTHFHSWELWGSTWSLSIEEHFYLLWPSLLRVTHVRRIGARTSAAVLGIAALVVGEITAGHGPGLPPLSYVQPQTHAFGLFAGCVLAMSRPPRWSRFLALPSFIGIVVLMVSWRTGSSFTSYVRFAIPLTVVLTCVLLAGVADDPVTRRMFSWAPIRRIGVISYGIYLYHQVTFETVKVHIHLSHWPEIFVELLCMLVVTEISFRWWESPIRERGRRWTSRRSRTPQLS